MVETPIFRWKHLQIFVYDVPDETLYPRITYNLPPLLPIVWIMKYRYRVLQSELRFRVRRIIAEVADEMG
jgi:ligand-binding SRPBCC domain-containing protein